MKLIFLIADGMGDWPVKELNQKTPLETAATPHMDALAREGIVGLCRTVPSGMPPGSDVANMSLLGFNPAEHHTGRGPIEAAAQGLKLGKNDLVWRLNLVTVTDLSLKGRMKDYSAGHIGTEAARPLIERLQQELGDGEFTFHPGVQYRHLLVQKNGAKRDEAKLRISPPHDITDRPVRPDLGMFSRSPRLWDLIFGAEEILKKDNPTKANSIWPWGQGRPLSLPNFKKKYGMSGAVISAVDLIKGLGRAAGMKVIDVPGATGLLDTDYEGKVRAALDFLKKGDFVFVHLEGPDECGHAGNALEKTEAIARFDSRVVGPMRAALKDVPAAWLVACDHLTPIIEKTHVADPVPFAFCAPGLAPSGVAAFTEKSAAASGLGIENGHELMDWCLAHLARAAT